MRGRISEDRARQQAAKRETVKLQKRREDIVDFTKDVFLDRSHRHDASQWQQQQQQQQQQQLDHLEQRYDGQYDKILLHQNMQNMQNLETMHNLHQQTTQHQSRQTQQMQSQLQQANVQLQQQQVTAQARRQLQQQRQAFKGLDRNFARVSRDLAAANMSLCAISSAFPHLHIPAPTQFTGQDGSGGRGSGGGSSEGSSGAESGSESEDDRGCGPRMRRDGRLVDVPRPSDRGGGYGGGAGTAGAEGDASWVAPRQYDLDLRAQPRDGMLVCRRLHCRKRFSLNQPDWLDNPCGYHPALPQYRCTYVTGGDLDGEQPERICARKFGERHQASGKGYAFYSCCGVTVAPGASGVFCAFGPHLP